MSGQRVLLFNASNMEAFPVYPYAFIQVPAIARQSHVEVICLDLLGIPQVEWAQVIQDLIRCHDPAMLLITLRNTDSLNIQDYELDKLNERSAIAYFPIERTKELIGAIRRLSDLKIVLGGFGFSVIPDELMHYLRPDFGICGGPDGFFKHLEEIQAGNFDEVPNLLYFQAAHLIKNPRLYYPPLAQAEYTPRVIEEMMAFYEAFPSPGFQGAPLEIMRGCGHACVFCSEPLVKGKQVRYRDLSAVMKDIEILVDNGVTRLYMVSSELNPEGNAFVLDLAERILVFNQQQQDDRKVTWFGANYLLNFSVDEYMQLHRSGFTGGWFDITALDDENARAMRTPYRNENLITYLKAYQQYKVAQFDLQQASWKSQTDGSHLKEGFKREELAISWSLFLGNPATTIKTIRNTLRIADREGLSRLFTSCSLFTAVRIFDYEEPDEATLDATYSVSSDLARTNYRQILPSFAYPPVLLREFGSGVEINRIFNHLGETFLSTKYQKTRDWQGFIQQKTTAKTITRWLKELTATQGYPLPAHFRLEEAGQLCSSLQLLFSKEGQPKEEKHTDGNLAKQIVDWLVSACLEVFPNIWISLGLPKDETSFDQMTPYELAVMIFARWNSEDALFEELSEMVGSLHNKPVIEFIRFCVQAILYKFNIIINPMYSRLFISDDLADQGDGQSKENTVKQS